MREAEPFRSRRSNPRGTPAKPPVRRLPAPSDYPESDGKPMAETPVHRRATVDATSPLEEFFRERSNVYVGSDMMMYYREGNPRRSVVPDVWVAFGVAKLPEHRTWQIWLEGKGPDFVLEITSKGTRREDEGRKKKLYEALGVREYWQFDPTGDYLEPILNRYGGWIPRRKLHSTPIHRLFALSAIRVIFVSYIVVYQFHGRSRETPMSESIPTPPRSPAVDALAEPPQQPHDPRGGRLPPRRPGYAAAGGRNRPGPPISSSVSGASDRSRGRTAGGRKEIFCAFGIDVDAVAGWLGSYGGEDSPCDISRGLFSGEVGVPRLVELFRRFDIRTTWFIPGHSVETFPDQCRLVADAGHEIGVHGYSHENPIAMTREQETAVLDKCIDLIERQSGRRPTGYVAPWWEFSPVTNELLLERGIKYDHSLMNNDFHPFYVRVGDSWTKIDYGRDAQYWMKPLVRGQETELIDIPANWYLDDLPPMMFIKSAPNSFGFIKPRDIEELWRDQFDWVYREYDYAVFTFTIHPDVSGRPQVLLMLERIYEYVASHAGVRFCTFDEIADDFRRRCPPGSRIGPGGEVLPSSAGER